METRTVRNPATRVLKAILRRIRHSLWASSSKRGRSQPYQFFPAPSIVEQRLSFSFGGKTLEVQANHSVPLYESIFEIVDADCYQLQSIIGRLAGRTVIDIGANVGVTTLCLSQVPGVSVLSFEPSPGTRRYLDENLRRNSCGNVDVRPYAVAARTGTMAFWVPDHETVGATEWKPWMTASGQKLEVDSISVSEMLGSIPGEIGLVKVDCEGGEYDIVESLTPELVKRVERLTFEVHDRGPGRDLASIATALQRRGYDLLHKPDPFGRAGLHHLLALRR